MVELMLCLALLQAGDPHTAYKNKSYDQALQGFLDMQVNHPDDAELMLNVGSTYYQLKDYPQAEKAFAQALAAAGDNLNLRQAAAYDLGNASFNQGKLDEAVQHYRESLAINSNDVDARHNLQLAEAELQRRKQEAQKQQGQRDEQKQQQQQQDSQQQQQQGDDNKPGQPKPQDGESKPQDGQPKPDQKPGDDKAGGADDPGKPPEGQGQQQPSKPGDKPEDAQQGQAKPGDDKKPAGDKAAGADKRGKQGPVLSPEQAERYLQSVGETRPKKHLRGKQVQRMPNGKDW